MYKYHCPECKLWFTDEEAMIQKEPEGNFVVCPRCEEGPAEEDACDTCGQEKAYYGEDFCEACLRVGDYPKTYTPAKETILELSLCAGCGYEHEPDQHCAHEQGPLDYDPTAGRYWR